MKNHKRVLSLALALVMALALLPTAALAAEDSVPGGFVEKGIEVLSEPPKQSLPFVFTSYNPWGAKETLDMLSVDEETGKTSEWARFFGYKENDANWLEEHGYDLVNNPREVEAKTGSFRVDSHTVEQNFKPGWDKVTLQISLYMGMDLDGYWVEEEDEEKYTYNVFELHAGRTAFQYSYGVYDYSTGKAFHMNDVSDENPSSATTTKIDWNGCAWDMSCAINKAELIGEWYAGGADCEQPLTFTVEVPHGYDGLVFKMAALREYTDLNFDKDFSDDSYVDTKEELDPDATFFRFGNPPAALAYASTQTVNVDGKAVTFECYALKDANGNATNYIKLRDLAVLLNGSTAQFQVGWDGAVTITTKTAYTPNGSELTTPYSGDRAYQETNAATKVNGQNADLAAFVLNDDAGGGYTYYQLRDLGKALGFNVGWAADKGIFVETDKPYDANN